MHKKFDHQEFEPKWQKKWAADGIYRSEESGKPKTYVLDMFPYPSGEGLHVGHPKGYIATDIYSRFKRMNGNEVLHPMGWDAFGLPAENFAIKNKVHPSVAVTKNVARFKEQLSVLGFDYDWEREINTTDPSYYKWTQWIFTKLFDRGLAYESHEPINWCPGCQTGLANEDVEPDGSCERCDTPVEQKPMRQWVLKIREYADRMLEDLDTLEWPEHIKEAQRNWIGRSEGAEIDFRLSTGDTVTVFTTRPDTLYGATYLVLAPEHSLLQSDPVRGRTSNLDEVDTYIAASGKKKEMDRLDATKEKTGVKLDGVTATNPASGEEIPVYIADYVLAGYGTGAIMAVPAHDERDHEFAQKYHIKIKQVVTDLNTEVTPTEDSIFTGAGKLINSDEFNGVSSEEAKRAITEKVGGRLTKTYKIKDWVFSRQRYWGEPIPIIHCEKCGPVAVPEEQLPVVLPEVEHYEPSGDGQSPLANIAEWVNTECPTCGAGGKRETNTMPQWAGSSWYYLRFMDPKNAESLVARDKENYWAPVDVYVGGDHAVRHLIYARFWHKFLYDINVVSTIEPFQRLEFLGFILAEDGRKMSKRWGNVINPDDIVKLVGADTLRVYEMFMGPFENTIAWSQDGLAGARRFLERVYGLSAHVSDSEPADTTRVLHKTIAKVTDDIEKFKFNTAVSAMMIFINAAEKDGLTQESYLTFLRLLSPFAPHITEELWQSSDFQSQSIHLQSWPKHDPALTKDETVTIGVQLNGKLRAQIDIPPTADENTAQFLGSTLLRNERLMISFKPKQVTKKLLGVLPDRARDVLEKRYGLGKDGETFTLEAIGQTYGITRERVRQIENYGIQSIQKSELYEEYNDVFRELCEAIDSLGGGLVPEHILLEEITTDPSTRNDIFFLLVLGDPFYRSKENSSYAHRWFTEKKVADIVEKALRSVHKSLNRDELITEDEVLSRFRNELIGIAEKHDERVLKRWLEISKDIASNPLGEWGHAASPNVKVKGIRDYAYLVVKRHGSPMHFREVADAIQELFEKKAHTATTHNELIKDERFVLVGRGLYALSEWGYSAGVVKDVLRDILEKSGPMSREEIIDKVRKERYVKDNTIVVNLQDPNLFKRLSNGTYMAIE
ncbi:leucine--tRNA ligase [Candidatus Pacebacteria bacterium]|nr:leucine--tRNA ligase [Candidatus Paceibacterota bacterium]